ncbi:MAG: hypothetical protein LBS23_01810 [Holosporaceae bacterium]|nr:hypothetical protein [Holosporaceae bacterium]
MKKTFLALLVLLSSCKNLVAAPIIELSCKTLNLDSSRTIPLKGIPNTRQIVGLETYIKKCGAFMRELEENMSFLLLSYGTGFPQLIWNGDETSDQREYLVALKYSNGGTITLQVNLVTETNKQLRLDRVKVDRNGIKKAVTKEIFTKKP